MSSFEVKTVSPRFYDSVQSWVHETALDLLEFSTPEQFPSRFDPAPAMAENAVVEYEREVAVSGNHGDLLTDGEPRLLRDVDRRMFRGQSDDAALRVIFKNWGFSVFADGLEADIEDRAVGRRSADDGRENGQ